MCVLPVPAENTRDTLSWSPQPKQKQDTPTVISIINWCVAQPISVTVDWCQSRSGLSDKRAGILAQLNIL
ncbi:hypothetical protein J6590_044011 [Homalodisca vitripennis]|nr:hypothetical protein J6590_044011 [Homalodisca vitripennis]